MNFAVDVMGKSYEVIDLFQNTLILIRPRVVISADVIKVVTMFIKKTLKTQKKLKELEIMYQNLTYICVSWYSCWFPGKNADGSRTQGMCQVIHIYFAFSLGRV